jgi:hypothetical protein
MRERFGRVCGLSGVELIIIPLNKLQMKPPISLSLVYHGNVCILHLHGQVPRSQVHNRLCNLSKSILRYIDTSEELSQYPTTAPCECKIFPFSAQLGIKYLVRSSLRPINVHTFISCRQLCLLAPSRRILFFGRWLVDSVSN